MNKNYLIIFLSTLSIFLVSFIVLDMLSEKKLPEQKVKIKTIIEERIVYIKKDIDVSKKKVEVKKEPILQKDINIEQEIIPIHEIQLLNDDKKYILSQAHDKKGRFHISILSVNKLNKEMAYKRKIILHTKINYDGQKAETLLAIPPTPILVEDISSITIRVKDYETGEIYEESAYCLEYIAPNYYYDMILSISGSLECQVIQKEENIFKRPTLEISDDLKKAFEKVQNNLY